MANSLVEVCKGLTIFEARVIVQAYCFCRNLPMRLRVAKPSLRLAFDTLEAQSKCKNYSPPKPVTTVVDASSQPDPAYMDPDDYDQSEFFQELQGLQPYYDKFQWLKDILWGNLHFQILDLPIA